MCLAIPSRIIHIEGSTGIVDAGGLKKQVSLILVDNPEVGEYVIIHAGFAINRIDEEAARESLQILREMISPVDTDT